MAGWVLARLGLSAELDPVLGMDLVNTATLSFLAAHVPLGTGAAREQNWAPAAGGALLAPHAPAADKPQRPGLLTRCGSVGGGMTRRTPVGVRGAGLIAAVGMGLAEARFPAVAHPSARPVIHPFPRRTPANHLSTATHMHPQPFPPSPPPHPRWFFPGKGPLVAASDAILRRVIPPQKIVEKLRESPRARRDRHFGGKMAESPPADAGGEWQAAQWSDDQGRSPAGGGEAESMEPVTSEELAASVAPAGGADAALPNGHGPRMAPTASESRLARTAREIEELLGPDSFYALEVHERG